MFRKGSIDFIMSVRVSVLPSAWQNSTPTGRIFMKFDFYFSKNCRGNSSPLKSVKNKSTLIQKPIYIYNHISFSYS